MHWPVAFEYTNDTLAPLDPVTKRFRLANVPVSDTWAALEKLVHAGKIRSIGISNFSIEYTRDLLKTAKIPPVCNQIEAHPYLQQPKLFDYLKENVRASPNSYRLDLLIDVCRISFLLLTARSETTSTALLGMCPPNRYHLPPNNRQGSR